MPLPSHARSPACSSTSPTPRPGRSAPSVAREMQPSHPEDSSYARAAEALRAATSPSTPTTTGPLTPDALAERATCSSSPTRPTASGSAPSRRRPPVLGARRARRDRGVRRAPAAGWSSSARSEQDKYGNNLDELLARFGIAHRERHRVQDYERHRQRAALGPRPTSPTAGAAPTADLLARVDAALLLPRRRRCGGRRRARARPHRRRAPRRPARRCSPPPSTAPGRVVVLADSDLFGDDCIGELGHERAVAQPRPLGGRRRRFARRAGAGARRRAPTRAGPRCATPTDALRAAAGARRLGRPDDARPRPRAPTSTRSPRRSPPCAPHFPHQADYLDAVVADLRAWAVGGFATPDFTRSLEPFRPDRTARDGIEHLVVFPMYLQNALARHALRGADRPRPVAGVARRARARRATTTRSSCRSRSSTTRAGYDSRVRGPLPRDRRGRRRARSTTSAAIFCDREAARFRARRRRGGRDPARLNLPPDAAALLASERAVAATPTCCGTSIHDRAHSHGDLPFDPFMIRQRAPYWMYSLEELRCDLTAFGEAVELEARGLRVRAQRAVRDPLRPPVPLPDHGHARAQLRRARRPAAVRLPAQPRLRALDRQPADDRVGPRRRRRRARCAREVEELYRAGIDRSKLAPLGRGARPRRRRTCRPPSGSQLGPRPCERSPTRGPEGRGSTWSRTTSSRCRCSTPRCKGKLAASSARPA